MLALQPLMETIAATPGRNADIANARSPLLEMERIPIPVPFT